MGVARANFRKGHCQRRLPAAPVYPHDFQLLVVYCSDQWAHYGEDPLIALARTTARHTLDGGLS
jgi:hypothetical protein